ADLPGTGLVQEGSRVGYRLIVAGDADAVQQFTATAREHLGRGQRLETVRDARPEIRSALDRAGRFLGLAALVSVVLAAVAVAMAARRHSERHLSGTAVMRCLGATQRTLVSVHVGELVLLALLGSDCRPRHDAAVAGVRARGLSDAAGVAGQWLRRGDRLLAAMGDRRLARAAAGHRHPGRGPVAGGKGPGRGHACLASLPRPT